MEGGKTVDDVTREEWISLVDACLDLLGASRMMFWELGGQVAKKDDTSYRDAIEAMVERLNEIGLGVGPSDEFYQNVEDMLRSGLPPDEWRALRDPCEILAPAEQPQQNQGD